jgi:hypothetical protein
MAYVKAQPFLPQSEDVDGNPSSLATVEFYVWNTTTPTPYYINSTGTPGGTSLTLNILGKPATDIFWNTSVTYKIVTKDAFGTVIDVLGPFTPIDGGLANGLGDYTDPTKGAALVAFYDPVVTAPVFLKTTSDIINGERVSSMRWIETKAERDAIIAGTTTTDHTTVLNQMFQDMHASKKANLSIHPGTYNSGKVVVTSNTKIWAHGVLWKAISGLSASDPMLINENFDGTDEAIELYGGTFQGNSGARSNALAAFIRVARLKIKDGARFTGNQYQALAVGGCTLYDLDVEVDNYGKTAVTTEGGAGLWIGNYLTDPSEHGEVKVRAHDGEWAGVYVTGTSTDLLYDLKINAQIYNVKEAGIFGAYFQKLAINRPMINGITKKNISGSGIELGGIDFTINGGIISDVAASCIALTDCQLGHIGGGLVTKNARRDSASFATGSHISIITAQASPNQPRNITIEGHTAYDSSSPSYAAVEIGNSGDAPVNVVVQNNNYQGTTFTSGDPIKVSAGKWGAGCYRSKNAGSWDYDGGVSADRGDNSFNVEVGVDKKVQRLATAITAPRTIGLATATAYEGAEFEFVRTGLGAGTVDVGGLKTLPAATASSAAVVFTGGAWALKRYGTL